MRDVPLAVPIRTSLDDIARMRRLVLRHMPVVDEQGRLQGILNLPGAGRPTKRERRETDRFKRRGGPEA